MTGLWPSLGPLLTKTDLRNLLGTPLLDESKYPKRKQQSWFWLKAEPWLIEKAKDAARSLCIRQNAFVEIAIERELERIEEETGHLYYTLTPKAREY